MYDRGKRDKGGAIMIVVQGPNMSGKLTDFDDLSLSLTANPNALRITFSVDRLNVIAIFSELSRVDKYRNSDNRSPDKVINHNKLSSIDATSDNGSDSSKQLSHYYQRTLTVYIVNHEKRYLLTPARCAFINEYIFDRYENLTRQNSMLVDPEFWGNPMFDMADTVSLAVRDIILSVLILAELSMNEILAHEHDVSVVDDFDLWEDDVDIYEIIERMRHEESTEQESDNDLADIIGRVWSNEEPFSENINSSQDLTGDASDSDDYFDQFKFYYFESDDETEFQSLEIADMKEFWEIIAESHEQNEQQIDGSSDDHNWSRERENESDSEINHPNNN